MRVFIFFRAEGWYPVELPSESHVLPNVQCNPGTIKVEDMDGNVVWPVEIPPHPTRSCKAEAS